MMGLIEARTSVTVIMNLINGPSLHSMIFDNTYPRVIAIINCDDVIN